MERQLQSIENQLLSAARAVDAILTSSGPGDLCKRIVHADFAEGKVRGCFLMYLDGKSRIRLISSYGEVPPIGDDLSAWDDSVFAESLRSKDIKLRAHKLDSKAVSILAIPFIAHDVPVGLLALIVELETFELALPMEFRTLISKLGAFYLSTLDLGSLHTTKALNSADAEDLTSRQLTILGHMSAGLVNLEIAKILMLSESTIRQETVRIYRALGVSNRQEASRKAKSLGLVPKTQNLLASETG